LRAGAQLNAKFSRDRASGTPPSDCWRKAAMRARRLQGFRIKQVRASQRKIPSSIANDRQAAFRREPCDLVRVQSWIIPVRIVFSMTNEPCDRRTRAASCVWASANAATKALIECRAVALESVRSHPSVGVFTTPWGAALRFVPHLVGFADR